MTQQGLIMPPKQSLEDRKAKLQAQLDAIETQEKENEFKRLSALGAGLQSAFSANPDLERTVMEAIDQHHKNNKDREILGLQKLTSNRGRPKSQTATSTSNPILNNLETN